MANQPVGIAILGVGTIGGEVARRLAATDDAATQSSGLRLRLAGALDRGPEYAERAGIDPGLATTDGAALIDDPNVSIVVEALGGEQPAVDLMTRALAQGKHVVTANKEAVSKHLSTILAAARDGDAGFLCEASVGGGIPLLVSLRHILTNNRVERIRGVVNGTTNFILHKMETEGLDYEVCLAEAQQLGYAEPDPTADVDGYDAAYKLAILASLMTGRHVHPDQVERAGIRDVSRSDMERVRARGGTIRLIADAQDDNGNLALRVSPVFVPDEDLFSRVIANYNAVEIVGDRVGPVWLHGQGAGPAPTASAILSDVVEAARTGSAATPTGFERR